MTSKNKTIFTIFSLALILPRPIPGTDEPVDFRTASFDELLVHVQRDGSTAEKRQNMQLAREELLARRSGSLAYLMDHAHIRNIWIHILIEQLANRLDAAEAVPVLLCYLDSEHGRTRKTAAFYLGFFDTPEYSEKVLPLLDDEEAAGAAVRTLGKWRAENATPPIMALLADSKERRRVLAANALGEIADPAAAPALIKALDDPYFTVRKCAVRALIAIGEPAREHLESVDAPGRIAAREIGFILDALRSGTKEHCDEM